MPTPVEKRIQQLLALASNNPNENEAARAAEKAQEMALRHGIELASVGAAGEPTVRVDRQMIQGKLDPWRRDLAGAVASSMGGRFMFINEPRKWSGTIEFFGPLGTTGTMVDLYRYLETQLDRLSMLAAAEHGSEVGFRHAADSMRWRRSWLAGAVLRVHVRLQARREAVSAESGNSQALVVVKTAVDQAMDKAFGNGLVNDNTKRVVDQHAFERGHADGAAVPLGDDELTNEKAALPRVV